jgi:hypothetical protein
MALGHNVFVGISPPVLGIYLRCSSSGSLAMLAAMRRASSRVSSLPVVRAAHASANVTAKISPRCPDLLWSDG